MGHIHDEHGPNRIAVEERNESFIIHPGYGYGGERGTVKTDLVFYGDERRVERSNFARHWRTEAHPEFLLYDVPHLIRALADLPTCPPIIKAGISLYFGHPEMLADPIEPDEAENLFRAFTGGQVDSSLLDSVTPKLEALAGKELVP